MGKPKARGVPRYPPQAGKSGFGSLVYGPAGKSAAFRCRARGAGLGQVGRTTEPPNHKTKEGSVRRFACLSAIGSLSLVTLGLVPAAAPASAPSASLHFVNQAALQKDGTVLVSLVYLCNPSAFTGPEEFNGFVAARLEQAEPSAFGERFEPGPNCNGKKHSVTLDLTPGPFHRGRATAQAAVGNADGSSFAETKAVLQVK